MSDQFDRLTAALADRYTIERELGAGGMAIVYLAEDLKHHRKVAVKVLRPELAAVLGVERFIQEITTTANLQHPHILPLFDSGEAGSFLYYVMPFIDGETLRDKLNRETQLGIDEAVRITTGIADALEYAHRHNVIHRDIKPENILLHDGRPMVADFGIARAMSRGDADRLTETGISFGTPAYMSPEQAAGGARDIDGRSDLYALACVTYEMLAGDPPFLGSTAQAVMARHMMDRAPPIETVRPTVPANLAHAIAQALNKVPADRFGTVAQFLNALREPGAGTPPATDELRPHAVQFVAKAHTVGREGVLAALRQHFEAVVSGDSRFVSVVGEPGIGKTTVVENFLAGLVAEGDGCAVGRGRCSERLAGAEAYLPVLEALESLIGGASFTQQHIRQQAPGWFRQLVSREGAEINETGAGSQERLKRELVAALRAIGERHPVVVFFEDLHWADASTIDVLTYLADRLDEMCLLIIATYRLEDMQLTNHPFLQAKLGLQSRGALQEIALEFLDEEDIEQYLRLEYRGNRFGEEFVQLIHRRTEGNPLFVVDLVRYLHDQGVIQSHEGAWRLAQSTSDIGRDLPQSVQTMVQRKIDRLGPEERRILNVASVQGYEFHSAIVAQTIKADPAMIEERLQVLDDVHALVAFVSEEDLPDGTFTMRYRFVHVLYQNALNNALSPTRRVGFSRSAADALASHFGDRSATIASELAVLFEAGRVFESAADHFTTAAGHAAHVSAHGEAAVYARRGLACLERSTPSPETTRRELALQTILGQALAMTLGWASAEARRVHDRCRELCLESGDPAELALVLAALWVHSLNQLDFESTNDLADQVLRLAEAEGDAALFIQAHHMWADNLSFQGQFRQSLEHARAAIELYDPVVHGPLGLRSAVEDAGVGCRCVSAMSLWQLGFPVQGLEMVDEADALADELGYPLVRIFAALVGSWTKVFCGEHVAARQRIDECLTLSQEHGFTLFQLWGAVQYWWVSSKLESGAETAAQLQRSIEAFMAMGSPVWSFLGAQMADAYLACGMVEEAICAARDGLAASDKIGDNFMRSELFRLEGEALKQKANTIAEKQRTGLIDQAERRFHDAIQTAKLQEAKSLELRAVMSRCRLWHDRGETEAARAALEEIVGWFTEGFETLDLRTASAMLEELR